MKYPTNQEVQEHFLGEIEKISKQLKEIRKELNRDPSDIILRYKAKGLINYLRTLKSAL